MKYLILFSLSISISFAGGGDRGGNGGDPFELRVLNGLSTLSLFAESSEGEAFFKKMQVDAKVFSTRARSALVQFGTEPLKDKSGQLKCALNFTSENKIQINKACESFRVSGKSELYAFLGHEVFGLMGIEENNQSGSQYPVSTQLLALGADALEPYQQVIWHPSCSVAFRSPWGMAEEIIPSLPPSILELLKQKKYNYIGNAWKLPTERPAYIEIQADYDYVNRGQNKEFGMIRKNGTTVLFPLSARYNGELSVVVRYFHDDEIFLSSAAPANLRIEHSSNGQYRVRGMKKSEELLKALLFSLPACQIRK